jgi:ribosomal protein S18 acetylase RimI-like enzyme
MLNLREVYSNDLDFLVRIDLKDEGYTTSKEVKMTLLELEEHRKKIMSFIDDDDKGALIVEDSETQAQIAMIMFRVRNRDEDFDTYSAFNKIERSIFPENGEFIEVFQLWINQSYRKMGLATKLKVKLEDEARARNIKMIYTHTEENNSIVLHLNNRLGYSKVRSGPIWDDVIRVSLVKYL